MIETGMNERHTTEQRLAEKKTTNKQTNTTL